MASLGYAEVAPAAVPAAVAGSRAAAAPVNPPAPIPVGISPTADNSDLRGLYWFDLW